MTQTYIDLYEQYAEIIQKRGATCLNPHRAEFLAKLKALGFPTRKTENYREVDFSAALAIDYGLNINRLSIPVDAKQLFHCDVPGINAYHYFVVNDIFYSHHQERLPHGVIVCSLREASEKYPELVSKHLNKLALKSNHAFTALNGIFAQDGFFMYLPEGVTLERPVQLINLMRSDVDFMANSHNLIILDKGASAKLLVCDHAADDVHFWANRTTEVYVGEGAHYEHYKLESSSYKMCNVCTLLVEQQAHSEVNINLSTLHNGVTRNNIHVDQAGESGATTISGMTIASDKQCVDNYTEISHLAPNGRSNELFKYVLDDEAKGIFTGALTVAQAAQKTAAFQTNRNILLKNTAKVRTKPQLEIYADDVKCSHGATTGQLDDAALFYMRQRGISAYEARMLLMYAFVNDVVESIKIEALRDRMRLLVEKRLRGHKTTCEGCTVCD